MGLLWSGIIGIMISIHPEKIPADAVPATALPTIKMAELGAAPQMAEPISKTTTQSKKVLAAISEGLDRVGSGGQPGTHHFME